MYKGTSRVGLLCAFSLFVRPRPTFVTLYGAPGEHMQPTGSCFLERSSSSARNMFVLEGGRGEGVSEISTITHVRLSLRAPP